MTKQEIETKISELSRKEKIIVVLVKLVSELIEQGLVTGADISTEVGRAIAQELQDNGFYDTVTDKEREEGMGSIMGEMKAE